MTEYDVEGYSGSYEPGERISDRLAVAVLMYWNEYLDVHGLQNPQMTPGLPDRSREANRVLNELGSALREAVQTLSTNDRLLAAAREFTEMIFADAREKVPEATDSLGPDFDTWDFEGLAKAMSNWPVVRDAVRIALGFEAAETLLATAEDRAGEMVDYIASRDLSEHSRAYLDRTMRLYLWGFDPECVVMCRSVLEAALWDALEDHIDDDQPSPPLERLIALAGSNQALPGFRKARSRKGWEALKGTPLWRADRIRHSANMVLHDQPILGAADDEIADPVEAIRDLATILSLLFPAGPGPAK